MTIDEVQRLVGIQNAENPTATNGHRLKLEQAIIPPEKISVIWRKVENGHLRDEDLTVWLVGQENADDGYRIIMRDDGEQFGLASRGFPNDKDLVLVGWYGSLLSAFLSM